MHVSAFLGVDQMRKTKVLMRRSQLLRMSSGYLESVIGVLGATQGRRHMTGS